MVTRDISRKKKKYKALKTNDRRDEEYEVNDDAKA